MFVTSCHIPFEARPVPIVGPSLAGKSGFAAGISADKYTVVMPGILIQKAGVKKLTDHLRRHPSFSKVGKYMTVLRICLGEREGNLL